MTKRALGSKALSTCLTLTAIAWAPGSAQVLSVCPDSTQRICMEVCEIEVPVLVTGSAELNALGFEFVFDGPSLNLLRAEPGPLVRGWQAFDAQHVASARIRVGGFAAESVRLAGTDTLVVLVFESSTVVGCTSYRTEGFVDDLEGAAECAGWAQWDPTCVELAVQRATWSSVKRRYERPEADADP